MPNHTALANAGQCSRDAVAVARSRSQLTLTVAAHLAAAANHSPVAAAVADMLNACASPRNVWTGHDLHNTDGETFDGVGTLWRCRSPLCQSCLSDKARLSRRRARAALARIAPRSGEHWRFVTLTGPTVADASLVAALHVYLRAWELLRKSKLWLSCVRAGVRGEEFTVSDAGGYHVHIHALALSRWIPQAHLRAEWTRCLRTAWADVGRAPNFNTHHGEAVVDVRLITAKRRGPRSISLDAAVLEVAKYCVKGSDWLKVRPAHLVEVAEVARWPRMFETFGDARKRGAVTSLDTQNLNDGETANLNAARLMVSPSCSLRQMAATLDRETWRLLLRLRVGNARRYRMASLAHRYPLATFATLGGDMFASDVGHSP